MSDNMTDNTLNEEKIEDLLAKHRKYLHRLDNWDTDSVAVNEVRLWINDLVTTVVPKLTPKSLNGFIDVKTSEDQKQCESGSELCESVDESETIECSQQSDNQFDSSYKKIINSSDSTRIRDNNNCDISVEIGSDLSADNTNAEEIIDSNIEINCNETSVGNSEQNKQKNTSSEELFTTLDDLEENCIENSDLISDNKVVDDSNSELSSDSNCEKSMDSLKRVLRTRGTKNSDKQSSDSSDVEFNDLSDSPVSDSDSDYQTKGKRDNNSSQRPTKYEKLLKDFRLKCKPTVELIQLSDNIVDTAVDDVTTASQLIENLEKTLSESLNTKGFVCRTMKSIKESKPKIKSKEEDSDGNEDKAIKRLLRIPKINSNKNNDKKSGKREKNGNDSNDTNDSESISSDKPLKKSKRMKTSTPIKKDNESDNDCESESDCEVTKVPKNDDILLKSSKPSKTVDILDSDVSSDEEIVDKKVKKNSNKNLKKTESEENGFNESEDNDEKDCKESDVKPKINKVLRSTRIAAKVDKKDSDDENDEKTVVDIDSNSDEEIVAKTRKVSKRRVPDEDDDEYNGSDGSKKSSSDESSDMDSSEGMDPSANDSDSEPDEDSKKSKKKNKKSSKPKKDRKKGRKRVKIDDSSDDDCKVLSDENDSPNKSRKHIRKIVSDKKLKQQTKDAAEAERERVKRIKDKQNEYNDLIKTRSLKSSEVKELILEFHKETKEVLVEVDTTLVKFLKPHQLSGIQFMYDCVVETIEQLEASEGSGAILAHSMGLGKTLQVITFLHTILSHKDIKKHIKKALVICPVNTIKNWANEFRIWLNDNDLDDLLVFEMFDAKTMPQRAELLRIWHKRGGVLIIGLTLFSSMVMGGRGKKPSKFVRDAIQTCLLDPGADVVICDEGHLLKNEKTAYNKAVSQIRTVRRVVLTGTPLQNNLSEYYVMVHFVKPNLLGTKKEFINRFVNPITNGQHEDSTDYDVKIMKKRVHILHTLLNGCVHRCDYNVLVPYLQPKHEFVISVLLTEKQIELYSYYLKNLTDKQRMSLLADYGVLRLVWNHPILLFEQHRRRLERAETDSLDEFIDDDDDDTPASGDSDIECVDDNKAGPSNAVPKRRMRTRFGNAEENETEEEEVKVEEGAGDTVCDAWFAPFLKKEEANQIELSGKFILLFAILEECEKLGDKMLVFSQSLDTLDLVEEMLKIRMERAAKEAKDIPEIDLAAGYTSDATNVWYKNKDYFRLDGSTASDYRKAWIDVFNDERNYRARLFLISTKAGGLGINLVGANRCIIFDASWNPTHDVQAIFRIFRFGQKKPVYVYRFVAQGSMEEKIYERQIMKQSLSCRVVDEQSIQRHFKASEMSELYVFKPDTSKDRPTPKVPKDRLLAELLINHKEYIVRYHEHDSLLENRPEEDMTEDEKLSAWNEYEQEKDALFLREQQERDARIQREYLFAQQQAQQQYQQQQYQQMAQQLYQQQQQQQTAGNPQMSYQSLLQNQIYQNIMRSQETLRRQQQQNLLAARLQQQTQQQPKQSTGLPGYDRLTVEDIANYLKSLNSSIDPQNLIQRIFSIIETGLSTCTKELEVAKQAMRSTPVPSPEIQQKYEKLAKEVFNLNLQKTKAQTMFKTPTNRFIPSMPNILRPNTAYGQPNDDLMASTSSGAKPSSVLIEEVD